MAGKNSGFDSSAFRTGIRFVFNLAAPVEDGDQATFFKPAQLVYNRPVDGDNVPFDPDATVTRVQPAGIKVACAIEYQDAAGNEIAFGTVTSSRLVITLLDDEYKLVKGCGYVVVGGEKYIYDRTEPPTGLFDVGLFVMRFTAENEL